MLCVRGECFSIRRVFAFFGFFENTKKFCIFRKIIFRFLYRCENSFFNFTFHFSFSVIPHIVARIYDGLLQFLRMKKIPSSRHRRDRMWMEKSVLLTGHR
jgi:hypothetical protein